MSKNNATPYKVVLIDGGNFSVKYGSDGENVRRFDAAINMNYNHAKVAEYNPKEDFLWEFEGRTGIAGRIAKYEGRYGSNMTFGDSKLHEKARLRILFAIHLYADTEDVNLIVASPIKRHLIDKEEIAKQLIGKHEPLTINGVTKTITIHDVRVTMEGVAAYHSMDVPDKRVRIIDIGSGTVNAVTFIDKRLVRDQSTTLGFGTEKEADSEFVEIPLDEILEDIAVNTYDNMTNFGWKKEEKVYLCGYTAKAAKKHFEKLYSRVEVIEPQITVNNEYKKLTPEFANIAGMIRLGRKAFRK